TMEEKTTPVAINPDMWKPIAPRALPDKEIDQVTQDLVSAKKPLIITSYLGKNPLAVKELVKMSEILSVPVIESVPNYMNFPSDHPMHCGYQWNTLKQSELLKEADLVLVFDSDVPWIPSKNKPSGECIVYHFDEDPLKDSMPLWYVPSKRSFAVDSMTALKQLNDSISNSRLDLTTINERKKKVTLYHSKQREEWKAREVYRADLITPEYLTACIREVLDEDTIIMNEGVSNFETIYTHLNRNQPDSIFGSGGGSLGWNGGAALGAKL